MKKLIFVISLILSFYFQGNTQCSSSAEFQWNSIDSCPTVLFTDLSTTTSSGIISWFWDFGDGNISNQQYPSHAYAANGSYTVCLTVSDSTCSDSTCHTVVVACSPPSCLAAFSFNFAGTCPTVSFTDASTSSPDPIINWFWDFGDGNTSTMQNPSHAYANEGSYTTCLIISSISCVDTVCNLIVLNCGSGPATIPTMSEWGLFILCLLLLIAGTLAIKAARQKIFVVEGD